MRNLKRVLSLALALVMVLGMMVITTSAADFTDADEITQIEAVEVLAAIGMVEGSNGAFNANGTFTREAAAKLLTYMLIGGDMAEKLAGTDVFTDVAADRWSAGYIAYCANLGYITGVGNDKFNPSGVLTDIELGKLVLCAIGFDAAKYTGPNWASAVTVDLIKEAELVDSVTGEAISREDACAMILAAMKYSETPKTYDVYDTDKEKVGTFTDLLEASLYAKILGGDVKASEPTDTLLAEVYGVTYDSDDTDKFGRPAVSYKKGNTINLVYAEEATATYAGADWKDVSKLMEDYDFSKAETIYNGGDAGKTYDKFYGVNGVTVEVYADKDDVVSKVIVTEGYVTTVKDIETDEKTEVTTVTLEVREAGYTIKNSAAATIAIDSENDKAAYALVKDYAEKDVFVGYYAPGWETSKELLKVADVETVEGKVTSKSADATYNGWVKIDGEKYEFANEYTQADVGVKDEGIFYLYNGYIVDYATYAAAAPDYAYVLATDEEEGGLFNKDNTTYYAQLLYVDGTVEIVEIPKADKDLKDTVVSYADGTGADKGKIDLTKVADDTVSALTIAKNNASIGGKIANNKTVFVVETFNETTKQNVYTVYTGVTNVPALTATSYAGALDKDNAVWTVLYVMGAKLDSAPITSEDVVYLANASAAIEDADLGTYYTYDAIVNGEITTIDATVKTLGGKLYSALTLNDDGLVIGGTEMEATKTIAMVSEGATDVAKDGVIKLGETSYIYNDATVVYTVKATGISTGNIDAIKEDANDAVVGYTTNGILTMVVIRENAEKAGEAPIVSTTDALKTAVAEGDVVLGANVTLTESLTVADKTINGNGNTITKTGTYDAGTNYVVETTGATVSNLTVADATEGSKGLRAVYGNNLTADVVVDNCVLDATYPINISNGNSKKLIVTDSALYGWTSYGTGLTSAEFTNCTFGEGTSGYAYLRPQSNTVLADCAFEDGFMIGAVTGNFTITLTDCTYDGETVTAENFLTLLTGNYQDTWDDTAVLKNCTITVDGDTVQWPAAE